MIKGMLPSKSLLLSSWLIVVYIVVMTFTSSCWCWGVCVFVTVLYNPCFGKPVNWFVFYFLFCFCYCMFSKKEKKEADAMRTLTFLWNEDVKCFLIITFSTAWTLFGLFLFSGCGSVFYLGITHVAGTKTCFTVLWGHTAAKHMILKINLKRQ